MKMKSYLAKKTLGIGLSAVMLVSMVPVYGESPTVDLVNGGVTAESLAVPAEPVLTETGTTTTGQIGTGAIKNDPAYQAIRERNQYRMTLVQEEAKVIQQIKAVDAKNKELAAQIKAKKETKTLKPEKTAGISDTAKALQEQKKALMEQLKQSKMNKKGNKGDTTTASQGTTENSAYSALLQQQINDLNSQISLQAAAKKDAKAAATLKKQELAAQKASALEKSGILKQYRDQIGVISQEIKTLRESKSQAWVAFRTHVAAKDLTSALGDMNTIISLKQQIIDRLNLILGVKNQITVELTNILNGTSTLPVIPETAPAVPAPATTTPSATTQN